MSAVRVWLAFKDLTDSQIALRVDFPHLIELWSFLNGCLWLTLGLLRFLRLLLSCFNLRSGLLLLLGSLLLYRLGLSFFDFFLLLDNIIVVYC